jgi:AcrR family transcriptional regulator
VASRFDVLGLIAVAPVLTSGARPAPARPEPEDTRARIRLAAVAQCEEFGLRRTTMDDVARRAGLARATLYRHFQSKDALVYSVILAEAERFFAALDTAVADFARSDERVVEGFAFALQYVRRHALLAKLLRTEPETLLPYLFGDSRLIAIATEAVAERIPGVGDPAVERADALAAAELIVRLVLSLALSPESRLGTEDLGGARRLARRYLVPGLHLPK